MTTKHLNLDIDSTLGGDNASDSIISSQKAIKSCIDNKTSGMVKKVNNISPDSSGNVTISIPSVEAYTASEVQTLWSSV